MSMTIEQAKSELMQIYGALSPDKQRAIDTLVKIEPKTGRWIENAPEYQNIDPPYICSECGHSNLIKTNYCEQCGAKMAETEEGKETETWNGIHAQITAPKGTFERIFNDADDDNDDDNDI